MNIFFSSLSGNELTANSHFRRVLERLGHRVFYFSSPSNQEDKNQGLWIEAGYSQDVSFESLVNIAGFYPDVFIYMEPGGIIPRGMENVKTQTACIISDTHRWLEARRFLSRFFDHVFLFHRNYLDKFNEHPIDHVHWMPYACDLDFFYPVSSEKEFDVAFIGKIDISAERQEILQFIKNNYSLNSQHFYYQKEIPEIYSKARVVLNLPLADDLNYRTFEAMSCGALLLTRRINNGQEFLFNEGEHYIAYENLHELSEKINYYLAHPKEGALIAENGLNEIRQNHSLDQRLKFMLSSILNHPDKEAPIRYMNRQEIYQLYAWLYEYWHLPDIGLNLFREARSGKVDKPFSILLPAMKSVLRMIIK